MKFYTDIYTDLSSSFVTDVFYDEKEKQAHVVLNENDLYTYSNVSKSDVEDLVNASSIGTFYNVYFKKEFGPAKSSGYFYPQDFEQREDDNNVIQGNFGATKEFSLSSPVFDQSVSGAPVVSDATPEYSLAEIPAKPSLSVAGDPEDIFVGEVVIHFTLHGKKSKFVCQEASDTQEALDELATVVTRLGLSVDDVKPKKVVFKFE